VIVIATVACPSRSLMIFGWTPARSISVAAVCRRRTLCFVDDPNAPRRLRGRTFDFDSAPSGDEKRFPGSAREVGGTDRVALGIREDPAVRVAHGEHPLALRAQFGNDGGTDVDASAASPGSRLDALERRRLEGIAHLDLPYPARSQRPDLGW